MISLRPLTEPELERFAAIQGDGADAFGEQLRELLRERLTRPEWWFVAERDGDPVGRAAFRTLEPLGEASTVDEMFLFGLVLPWDADYRAVGAALLGHALPVVAVLGPPVDARLNAEVHDHLEQRRAVLEATGFALFQEKVGYVWQDGGQPIDAPRRLSFRDVREVGRDAFAGVMGAAQEGTLDRNDRYFWAVAGPEGWGREMLGYLSPEAEATWKLAYDGEGNVVGFIALSPFDEKATATITHVGVLPAHRGRGYVDDLLARGTADARAMGWQSIVSDVDVLNGPMRAAMLRAGHHDNVRPWHVWHYRYPAGIAGAPG